ncbi:TetR family transcriptional regulator [Kitasatospora sp. NPDC056327]|uniref:TetR family transcriptional regulator n=1 Tax=Kitasatospora sp. NPDC056327 TaxID=3345785 RepID=UPI0035D589FC
MRQERAQQTHRALLLAAATEFDRHGYAGTSLARVSQTAGVTMGALTFHFPSKASLADAVRAQAAALTRAAVTAASAAHDRPGTEVGELIDTLTRLLDEEPSVRAAARLTWEQPESAGNWHAGWSPDLRDRLARERTGPPPGTTTGAPAAAAAAPGGVNTDTASANGAPTGEPGTNGASAAGLHATGLHSPVLQATGLDSADLETLAHCLVVGSEALRRGIVTLGGDDPAARAEVRERLGRLWRRAVTGPPAPGAPH